MGEYAHYFKVDDVKTDAPPRSYNVAPTDAVLGVADWQGRRILGEFRWGLVPYWAKDYRSMHINARMESVSTKPAFRVAFTNRRCLVPADGFYEWKASAQGRVPYYLHQDRDPLAMAGLWSRWRDPDSGEKLSTCSIITGPASSDVEPIHDRMPMILQPELWDDWLDPEERDPAVLMHVLNAASPRTVMSHRVSLRVNHVANNDPQLITPDP